MLFRSKLGSVSVLHLKADQTCNFNFVICLLTWTYPSLQPCCVSDFVTLVCLIGLTTLMPTLFFYSSGLTSGCQFFSSSFIYLDLPPSASQKDFKSSSVGIFDTYLMQCFMQCMIMNGMSEYLNLSFSFEFCFIPLF